MKYLFFLLGLFLLEPVSARNFQPLDSVGIRKIDGKYYVLHKVDKGQGLFAIARRYNSTVDEITKANPEVKDGLKVGQTVMIPVSYVPPAEEVKKEDVKPEETIVHVVKTGETLYKIAQHYKVPVDQIKRLNQLEGNNISIGQELIIQGVKKAHTENYGGEEKKEEKKPAEDKKEANAKPDPGTGDYEYNSVTGEVKESGFANVVPLENIDQERSFALHASAPIGTIIMVTNAENNKSVFVRVVGKAEATDPKLVIQLTRASASRLGIEENTLVKVKLNYAR
jgi:LysM repeat protein